MSSAEHPSDEPVDLLLLADVTGERLDQSLGPKRRRLRERFRPPSADHDPGAERGELQRDRPAEPGTAAADNRHLIVEQPVPEHA
jgi:hypothetical protein